MEIKELDITDIRLEQSQTHVFYVSFHAKGKPFYVRIEEKKGRLRADEWLNHASSQGGFGICPLCHDIIGHYESVCSWFDDIDIQALLTHLLSDPSIRLRLLLDYNIHFTESEE